MNLLILLLLSLGFTVTSVLAADDLKLDDQAVTEKAVPTQTLLNTDQEIIIPSASKSNESETSSQFAQVDLTKKFTTSFSYEYPSFKGMLKTEAQEERKKFLQKSMLESLDMINKIVQQSGSIKKFLETNFPKPLPRKSAQQFIDKDYDRLETTGGGNRPAPHWANYFYEDEGISEDQLLSKFLTNYKHREEYYTLILSSESDLKARRLSEKDIKIDLSIDFPAINKKLEFKNIAEAMKQPALLVPRKENASINNEEEFKKFQNDKLLESKTSATFFYQYPAVSGLYKSKDKKELDIFKETKTAEIFDYLFSIPSRSSTIQTFLKDSFVGPFNDEMEGIRSSLRKNLTGAYVVNDECVPLFSHINTNVNSIQFPGLEFLIEGCSFHSSNVKSDKLKFEYTGCTTEGEGCITKNEAISNLIKDMKTRNGALGFLLVSLAEIKLDKTDPTGLKITVQLDMKSILKKHPPKRVTDYVEK